MKACLAVVGFLTVLLFLQEYQHQRLQASRRPVDEGARQWAASGREVNNWLRNLKEAAA